MKKTFVNHLIAIGIFLALACIFSYPSLQGNKLVAGDTVHWMGMSHEAKEWYQKTGESVMWSNSMFGGMPTPTYALYGNHNYIWKLQEVFSENIPNPIFYFFIAMLCFYIFTVSWKWNKNIGIIGSIAYAFAAYNIQIIVAGHSTKMFSICYIPLILAAMQYLYNKKYLLGSGLGLLGMSLLIANSMYQMIFYYLFVILAFAIGYLLLSLQENKLKEFFISALVMIVITVVSLGPNLNVFMFTKEYSKTTMRGGESEITIGKTDKKTNGGLDKDYAFRWSQGIGEVFTLLVPNLYGGGNRTDVGTSSNTYEAVSEIAGEQNAENFSKNANTYWGPQPFLSGPVYFGAIILFLFVMSLFLLKNKFKWLLVGVAVFGIILSWGKNLEGVNYFLFDHLPMYNKFRTPSMAMTISGLAICILAIWGLNEFFKENLNTEKLLDTIKKSFIITGGLCLLLGVGGRFFMSFKGENDMQLKAQLVQTVGNNEQAGTKIFNAIVEDRPTLAMKDGLRSFVFILLAAAALWFYQKRKLNATLAMLAVGLLISIDILGVGTRYISTDNYVSNEDYEAQFNPRPVDMQINQDPDPYYRVFDLSQDPYNDAMQAYHHKCVGGYHPAKMEIYQDLIDNQLSSGKMNAEVLNMLNTKYLIFNAGNQPQVNPNPNRNGNAWFVNNVKLVPTANDEILALNAENISDTVKVANPFRSKETAVVLQKNWKGNTTTFTKDSTAKIALTKYGVNNLQFESNNAQNGFGVFSDIYYPYGWHAFVDGKETPIMKTDYVLRGIEIPAGKHQIEFKFEPQSYLKYTSLSTISSIVVLLILLAGIGMSVKEEVSKKED